VAQQAWPLREPSPVAQPAASPPLRVTHASARETGDPALTIILLAASVLLLGMIGLGGVRVLARATPPPAPRHDDSVPVVDFDPIEAELQAMLAEEQPTVVAEAEARREMVPL
jgi:hypothetical protein